MYKTQGINRPEQTRVSFHRQGENKDKLIFKVMDMGPMNLKTEYAKKPSNHSSLY